MTSFTLKINGKTHGPTDIRDDLSMNDYLREYLGMTGTKFGCGAAQCLACAVIIDAPDGTSRTSPTCVVPAMAFNGQSIRTVEGHARDGEPSELQKAFVTHFSFQCGYCTAGMVMSLTFLHGQPDKTDAADAAHQMCGNLCRCTGYGGLRRTLARLFEN